MPHTLDLHTPDVARILAFVCAPDSRIESVASIPGVTRRLSAGQNLLDAFEPTDGGLIRHFWTELVKSGHQLNTDVMVSLAEGGPPLRMLVHAMPLHKGNDEGMFLVTLCSGFQAIRSGPDEVARCRAVLDTAVDAVVTIDVRGSIRSINPATTRMFGYSPEELIGRNVRMLMPEPYRSEHDRYLNDYLTTGRANIIGIGRQTTGRKKNGFEFPVHLAVSEYDVRGTRYFTGIIRDLTELEHVQRQLLQAERLAAIGQMVTGLAHESRNALQRAQACLDMLSLDLQEQPDQLDLARRATHALQDLHRLYEEVRSYASPIHLEFRDCDLSAIWRKEWENLSSMRKDRLIRLIETDSVHPECEVDVHRMEQVFRNILENAIHACGDEGTIRIRCENSELNGQAAVRVSVEDDGEGMTPQTALRIFEPFFTTKQKGTGLGMAIVHRIISAHSGCISARAISPTGAEIAFVIPVRAVIRNAVRC